MAHHEVTDAKSDYNPWPALWALVLGFFMILVDSTIVSVATPVIREDLNTTYNAVLWVTSAYLLAYAVPLLITGRLGDRFGPKNLYLGGLTLFTLASLWCGLTGSVEMLIVARIFQGLGASMMTPQTMAVITRTFPASNRGQAMALWGAAAGVATLVGPILGGILIDTAGWQWIFFINVPIGILAFYLCWKLVPSLETHSHSFDLVGVALSAIAMFCIVFGIQEGEKYDWGQMTGIISVPALIAFGLIVLAVFIYWQSRIKTEPLVPLSIFKDRNFSLANVAISTVGFAITAMAFPFFLYAQEVRGLSATKGALFLVPMAVLSGALAPWVGKIVDRVHPRTITAFGLAACSASMFWLSHEMTPDSRAWQILLPMALLGVANAFMWAPLGATATRNLPLAQAGAGAGIYNTTRQLGAVLGSAGVAALIQARLAANLPGLNTGGGAGGQTSQKLPAAIADQFSRAMAQSVLLPAIVLLIGLIAALAFARPDHVAPRRGAKVATP